MTKPAVVLIGADKGGVGKTMVARTLLDYFAHRQVRARAFDTEVPRGTLKRFHPDVTEVVDINRVPDQMRIFDTVNSSDATISLIDVSAGILSPTLRAILHISLIQAAKKGRSRWPHAFSAQGEGCISPRVGQNRSCRRGLQRDRGSKERARSPTSCLYRARRFPVATLRKPNSPEP